MNTKLIKALSIIAIVLLGTSLAACGKKTQEPTDEIVYVASHETLDMLEDNEYLSARVVDGDNLYAFSAIYSDETGISGQIFHNYNLKTKEDKKVTLDYKEDLKTDTYSNCTYMALNKEGNIVAMFSAYGEEGDSSYAIYIFDKEGKVLEKNDLQNSAGEFNYISSVCADKDGNLYLGSDNAVIVIDEKGNILSKIDVGNWISGIACKDDGTVYISTYSQSGNGLVLRAVDLKSKSLGEEITGAGDFNSMVFGKGDEVYLIAEMTAYKFDLKTKEKTPMWDWVDADVYETYNGELFDNGDGTFTYLNSEYSEEGTFFEIIKLEPKKRSEVVQKTEITFGCHYMDYLVKRQIAKFNREHDDIKIIPKAYGEMVDDWEEASKRFDMDIMAGDVLDIVDIDTSDYIKYAKAGIFEDLYPYLDSTNYIDKTDLFDSVLEGAEYNGKLYAMPATFSISTIIGKKGVIKENPTIQDFLELRKKYPDKSFYDGATASGVLYTMMYASMDEFVDAENGNCNFDSEEFYSLLEFAKTFPKEIDYENFNRSQAIRTGDAIFADGYISSCQDLQYTLDMFDNEAEAVGYPSKDGNGTVMRYASMYGVSSKSKNKDIAWQVISEIVKGPEKEETSFEFPVLKSRFDAMIKEETTPYTYKDENGVEHQSPRVTMSFGDGDIYEYYYAKPETVDIIMKLISKAKIVPEYDETIYSIIDEETAPFFEGQKSKEEVSDIIQKRIKIYLQEKN